MKKIKHDSIFQQLIRIIASSNKTVKIVHISLGLTLLKVVHDNHRLLYDERPFVVFCRGGHVDDGVPSYVFALFTCRPAIRADRSQSTSR